MPGKHNAGGCGCCGCWDCGTSPDSVALSSSASPGTCCEYPNGTFVVGAAASSTIGSRGSYYDYDISLHKFGSSQITSACHWVWFYINHDYFCCDAGVPSLPSFACVGHESHLICQTSPYMSGGVQVGEYGWAIAAPTIYVKWQRSPRKIVVVVDYTYYFRTCLNDGTSSVQTYSHHDEYVASVTCDALPATINWAARYDSSGTVLSSNTVTYGSSNGGPYTFTFCPSIASVDLTYA